MSTESRLLAHTAELTVSGVTLMQILNSHPDVLPTVTTLGAMRSCSTCRTLFGATSADNEFFCTRKSFQPALGLIWTALTSSSRHMMSVLASRSLTDHLRFQSHKHSSPMVLLIRTLLVRISGCKVFRR